MSCVPKSLYVAHLLVARLILVVAGLTIALARIMAGLRPTARAQAISGHGCVDEYNALLLQCEGSLEKG